MATNELPPLQRIEVTRAFSSNARFYAPEQLTQKLHALATADTLALIVDVDALDRTTLARGDRVTTLALEALTHVRVQVVFVSRGTTGRARTLQQAVPRSWCVETKHSVVIVRDQMPGVQVIAVSDDVELLAALGTNDRGITLTGSKNTTNVNAAGEISVRAVLWWLVDLRSKAGMAARL